MAEVKWIKIATDIFDDEKILLIESMPDSYAIITAWFKLLCLAGKMNNSGVFIMNDRIAYTDKMLATVFRMKETTVKLALDTFERFGMIERIDGAITIPNWGKHQNLDSIERKREYQRGYMRESESDEREQNFEKIYAIYPKKRGRTRAFSNYCSWLKGRTVNGKRRKLTNREMYLAVYRYVEQQKAGGTELEYYKNFDTLMGSQLLDYVEDTENEQS